MLFADLPARLVNVEDHVYWMGLSMDKARKMIHFHTGVDIPKSQVDGHCVAVWIWSERFDAMPDEEFCGYLKELSGKIDMSKFAKNRRGPKKKVVKTYDPKVNHVSTFKVLQERKNKAKLAP